MRGAALLVLALLTGCGRLAATASDANDADAPDDATIDAAPEATIDAAPEPTTDAARPSDGQAGGGDAAGLDGGSWTFPDASGLCAPAPDASDQTTCGCTRRPGSNDSFQCPQGVGELSTATIGPDGSSVELAGRQYVVSGVTARLDFPPTAVAAPTSVTLTETPIPPPHDLLDGSPVYRVEPLGLALAARTPLRLPYSNASSGTTIPRDLAIWFSPDGACFTRVSDSYTNAGFEQGSITQLGYLIVGAPRTASTLACP